MKLNYFLIAPYSVNGVNNSSIEECLNYISSIDDVSVDIETTRKFKGKYGKKEGLDPYLSDIVMLQVGDGEKQFVIDTRYINIKKVVKLLSTKTVIGHNIKFEYKHLLVNTGIRLLKVYDTMIAEIILFNGLKLLNSLEALNKRYLNITVDKSTRLEFLTIGKKPFTKKQIEYGAEDILYPYNIRKIQLKNIADNKMTRCLELEMEFLMVLGDIEVRGMNFNKTTWLEAYEVAKVLYQEKLDELNNYVIKNHPKFCDFQLGLFGGGITCAIQWPSSKQVIKFFDYLGICPEAESKTTKKIRKTVEAKEMKNVLTDDNLSDEYRNLINTYLKFKESEQSCSNFGESFFKYINPITSRIHSNFNQIVNTGRISSKAPNLQNIPSNAAYRKAFDAPEGYKIVNADYSGQEQIVLANKSMDPSLLEFYDKGHSDMHSFVTSKLFPELANLSLADIKKLHPDKRQIAKGAGFAINYGGTGFTIAKNLGISETQGNFVYDSYFKAFPGLKNYFAKCNKAAVAKGYILIDKITGRKYTFPFFEEMLTASSNGNFRKYNRLKGMLERASLNYPIQGESGSITKLAAVLIRKYLLKHDAYDKFQMTNLIHDEINCEAKEEHAQKCADVMELCMKRAGNLWCKRVPLKAEAVIGDYWAH